MHVRTCALTGHVPTLPAFLPSANSVPINMLLRLEGSQLTWLIDNDVRMRSELLEDMEDTQKTP